MVDAPRDRSSSSAGVARIAIPAAMVNPKANGLNNNSARGAVRGWSVLSARPLGVYLRLFRLRRLARPAGLHEEPVLLAEVARGRGDDGSFADYDFAILLQRLPNIVFADEVGWRGRRC